MRHHRHTLSRCSAAILLAPLLVIAAASTGCTSDAGPEARTADRSGAAAGEPVARDIGRPTTRHAGLGGGRLYVVEGTAATTAPLGDGRSRVTVDVADPRVLAFTDRPARGAGREDLASFVDGWPTAFAGDPPNAALTGTATDGADSDTAVELTDPSWNPATRQLTVTARPIGADAAKVLPASYRRLDLFIDDAAGVAMVSLNLPGTPTSVNVAPYDQQAFYLADQAFTWQSMGPGGFGYVPGTPFVSNGYATLLVTANGPAGTTSLTLGFGQWTYQVNVTFTWAGPPTATVQQLGPADLWAWAPYRMQPAAPASDPLAAVPVPDADPASNVAMFEINID